MSRGDQEHVAKQTHGVQFREDPPAPQTIEQRVAKLEAEMEALVGEKEAVKEEAVRYSKPAEAEAGTSGEVPEAPAATEAPIEAPTPAEAPATTEAPAPTASGEQVQETDAAS